MKMKQDECVPLETMHERFNLSLLEEEDIKAHKGLVLSTGLYFLKLGSLTQILFILRIAYDGV